MKKLFLFTCLSALALSFNSCSSDDDSSSNNNGGISGTVSFKVNGVQKTFNTVTVDEDFYTEDDGDITTYYDVTASNNGSSTEFIEFRIYKGDTGGNSLESLDYTINNDRFSYAIWWGGSNFSTNTTANNSSKLKGTFSGTLYSGQNDSNKQITDGTFDINL